jgi:hypothetical protein
MQAGGSRETGQINGVTELLQNFSVFAMDYASCLDFHNPTQVLLRHRSF